MALVFRHRWPTRIWHWVNALAAGVDLSDVADLPDDQLETAARSLAAGERGLSERRRGVQQVMDGLASELGRRYRDGEADVAQLLAAEGRLAPAPFEEFPAPTLDPRTSPATVAALADLRRLSLCLFAQMLEHRWLAAQLIHAGPDEERRCAPGSAPGRSCGAWS